MKGIGNNIFPILRRRGGSSRSGETGWLIKLAILVLVVHAIWGIGQFIVQQDFGLQKIWETEISPDKPAIAKFNFNNQKIIRAYGPYPHPNSFAGAMAIGLILLLSSRKIFSRKTETATLGIMLIALVTTFSRTGLLVFLIFITLNQIRNLKPKLILIVALILLTFSPLLIVRQQDQQDVAISERYQGYQWSLELIKQNPLTGVGIGNYKNSLKNYLDQNNIQHQPWQIDHVHSVPLLLTATLGIPPALIILGAILLWLFPPPYEGGVPRMRGGVVLISLLPILLLDHYLITQPTPAILLVILLGYTASKS